MANGPFTIRGVEYPNNEAAAKAFGLSVFTIKHARYRGREDFIGGPCGAAPMPVRIRGKVYASAKIAAKALKLSPNHIRHMIADGREDFIGTGMKRVREKGTIPANAIPFAIGTFIWPSRSAAARALGMSRSYFETKIKNGDVDFILSKAMDMTAKEARARAKAAEIATRASLASTEWGYHHAA